jgi:mono/diheme cytochrome c family protein
MIGRYSTLSYRTKESAMKETSKPAIRLPAAGQSLALFAIVATALAIIPGARAATKAAASGSAANGQKLYASQGCATCHKIGGKGGKIGPDLSKEGTKRDAQWLVAFMKNPRSKVPKGSMPAVQAKAMELQDLAAYMRSLK